MKDVHQMRKDVISTLMQKGVVIEDKDLSFFSHQEERYSSIMLGIFGVFLFGAITFFVITGQFDTQSTNSVKQIMLAITKYTAPILFAWGLYITIKEIVSKINSKKEFSFIAVTNDFIYSSTYRDLKKIPFSEIKKISRIKGERIYIRHEGLKELQIAENSIKNANVFYEILKEKTGLKG